MARARQLSEMAMINYLCTQPSTSTANVYADFIASHPTMGQRSRNPSISSSSSADNLDVLHPPSDSLPPSPAERPLPPNSPASSVSDMHQARLASMSPLSPRMHSPRSPVVSVSPMARSESNPTSSTGGEFVAPSPPPPRQFIITQPSTSGANLSTTSVQQPQLRGSVRTHSSVTRPQATSGLDSIYEDDESSPPSSKRKKSCHISADADTAELDALFNEQRELSSAIIKLNDKLRKISSKIQSIVSRNNPVSLSDTDSD